MQIPSTWVPVAVGIVLIIAAATVNMGVVLTITPGGVALVDKLLGHSIYADSDSTTSSYPNSLSLNCIISFNTPGQQLVP
jgi:hypothetical protein